MASEGSLLLIVEGSLNVEQVQRGGRGWGEHERTGKGSGGGHRNFTGEYIRRVSVGSDFEGVRGGGGGGGVSSE